MRACTTTPPLCTKPQKPSRSRGKWSTLSLRIKTLAVGVNEQGRFYYIGGFKGHQWYVPSSWARSAPGETAAKSNRAALAGVPGGLENRSATNGVTGGPWPPISSLDPL